MEEELRFFYEMIVSFMPQNFKIFPLLILLTIGIAAYGIIIWVFYMVLSKKDILTLNLSQYNNTEHEVINKIGDILLYVLEFIIIYPILIAIYFFIFSTLLLILARDYPIQTVLVISASVIAATRICAYYKEDLSKDLAKMFPLTLLCIAILTPGFLNLDSIFTRIGQIPSLITPIFYYILFIFIVETLLRLISLFDLFHDHEHDIPTALKN